MRKVEIKDVDDPRVAIYTALNEKQLKHYYEPDTGIFICESKRVIERAIHAGYEIESMWVEASKLGDVLDMGLAEEIPLYVSGQPVMEQITGYSLTGGVLAAMKRKQPEDLGTVLASSHKLVILEDVENPTNVGAIFRSAAALGADAILLTEGCSDPLYRRAARVSMGTVFSIKWRFVPQDFMNKIKSAGFFTIALALSERAKELNRGLISEQEKTAVILGNEDHGIDEETLGACDIIAKIPMTDGVDSLNVSAASAVAFWELFHG